MRQLISALPLLLVLACNKGDDTGTDTNTDDTAADTGTSDTDTDTDTNTDVPSDETNRDGVCSFNRECPADQRCDCNEVDGCACADGVRGTGVNGVDTCDSGNDCASSLCVEGPSSDYYCSDECVDATDCTGALPVCADIAFVGRICIRETPPT